MRSYWRRRALLKISVVTLAAVLLAGAMALLRQAAPQIDPGADTYVLVASTRPASGPVATGGMRAKQAADLYDDKLLADFTVTNEASLVALRGYVLTESEGFKAEWESATARLDAVRGAIAQDSRSWTDGGRLVELAEMQKDVDALVAVEKLLMGLVGTQNRYPGLRLYTEDVVPAFAQSLSLIDETLQSILAANRPGAAASVDALAHIRGDVNGFRLDVSAYLPSAEVKLPDQLKTSYAAFERAPDVIAQLRGRVGPQEQARLDRLAVLLKRSDGQIQQILALKQTPRWDYADYVFKEKVLPLAEKISAVVRAWRYAS